MKFKKEVQIGLLTVLALVLGYIGINYLKGIEIFKKTTTYYAHFDNLNSVTVATPVIVSGFKCASTTAEATARPSRWRSIPTYASAPRVSSRSR